MWGNQQETTFLEIIEMKEFGILRDYTSDTVV
jgi:hypothetical protein